MLGGKKIIVGVTGSIAAYKMALLIRLLVKAGADVQVIMTPAAKDFITPLTLATLSKNPVLSKFVKGDAGEWNNHVALAQWSDAILIAPASANTIAKMANGLCDNLLQAVYLSAKCPVIVAPAMDLDMYQHPAVHGNLKTIVAHGTQIIDATYGELASGLVGIGRMAEPEDICSFLENFFEKKNDLGGKRVLVTAGPTQEAIDPVRYISNHSSGKMGYAIAEEMASRGAKVSLISGPTNLPVFHPNIIRISVTSALQMYEQCKQEYEQTDIAIYAAAVADYKPASYADQKVKKKSENLAIELVENPDIAASLGKLKKNNQIAVGFALETQNEIQNAQQKLAKKNLDFIVLNSLNDTGAGFGKDTNQITIIDKDNNHKKYELKTKTQVAKDIVNEVVAQIHHRSHRHS